MDALNDLDKLALKYGADKWGKHHYTPVYYELFKDRRETVKKVLEIGIAEGASLFMWRDFFPNAVIHGADNDFGRVANLSNETGMRIYPCDQTDLLAVTELIRMVGRDIDLVIDDGSHKPQDQLFTCAQIMPLLKDESIYVIEDVADASFVKNLSIYDCEIKIVGKRYDDCLVIVRRKNG